ncbi:alpha/beta hydrolase [Leuconostoc carnosum]|uniref:alpha/beta hydrolase n=1 Tax=Leuconostoc carnosum TaxID=1252 RepID=UPI00345E7FE7
MKNKIILGISLVFLIILGIYGNHWVTQTSTNQAKIQNSRMTPIIFIPGSSATINRFDQLFSLLNETPPAHSVLKVQVDRKGKLTYIGNINANDQQPFIVVGFENNDDGYNNIKKQTKWLTTALTSLQERYHFKTFSAVGHSNGGLIWTNYLEKYYDRQTFNLPTLMTLGTPFNFSEPSLQQRTEMLKDFIQASDKLPPDLTMFSIAGTDDYTNDGLVPIQSVIAGRYIYQKRIKAYTQITVSGDNAQHSNLPDNPEIVKLIQTNIINPLNAQNK